MTIADIWNITHIDITIMTIVGIMPVNVCRGTGPSLIVHTTSGRSYKTIVGIIFCLTNVFLNNVWKKTLFFETNVFRKERLKQRKKKNV